MSSNLKLKSLKQKTITGTMQLILREIGMKGIAIFGQILLVKLLAPSIFGIFAILSFILSTAEIFTDIGLSLTVIQNKSKPTMRQLSTILYLKMILSTLCFLILIFISSSLPYFYKGFGYQEAQMLQILSVTLLFKPFQTLTSSLLERDLDFKKIAYIDLSGIISYYISAILLAFLGFGIWSFIWAVVLKSIAEFLTAFMSKPWFPKWVFSYSEIKQFIKLGKYFQIGFILTVIKFSVIPVVAGFNLPIARVGLLDWSYNISSLPRVFIDNVGRVAFASFSRIQNDKKSIAKALDQAFSILSIPAIFIIPSTIFFGHDAILYFLNDKWIDSLPALNWYVASIFFLNGNGLLGHALLSIGKLKEMIWSGFFITVFEIALSYVLLKTIGFSGIALAFFISNAILFFVFILFCKTSQIPIRLNKTLVTSIVLLFFSIILFSLINLLIKTSLLLFTLKLILAFVGYVFIVFIVTPDVAKKTLRLIFLRQL